MCRRYPTLHRERYNDFSGVVLCSDICCHDFVIVSLRVQCRPAIRSMSVTRPFAPAFMHTDVFQSPPHVCYVNLDLDLDLEHANGVFQRYMYMYRCRACTRGATRTMVWASVLRESGITRHLYGKKLALPSGNGASCGDVLRCGCKRDR